MVRVEAVLDSWNTVRKDTAQALLDMPAEHLRFQPTPDLMPFDDIARHILNAGRALSGLLLDRVDDLTAPDFRDRMKGYYLDLPADLSAGELAARLSDTLESDCAALAACPADFFAGMVTRWDGARLTRLEMVQFIKEHELTHRSQMFLYLRLQGVVPPTTRRRMAKK